MAIISLNDLQVVVDEYLPGWEVDNVSQEKRIIVKHATLPGVISFAHSWFIFRDDEEIIQRLKNFKEENPQLFQPISLHKNAHKSDGSDTLALSLYSPQLNYLPPITEDNPNLPENPQDGMAVFDTAIGALRVYSGGEWITLEGTKESINPLPEPKEEPKPKKKSKPVKLGQRKVKFEKNGS